MPIFNIQVPVSSASLNFEEILPSLLRTNITVFDRFLSWRLNHSSVIGGNLNQYY